MQKVTKIIINNAHSKNDNNNIAIIEIIMSIACSAYSIFSVYFMVLTNHKELVTIIWFEIIQKKKKINNFNDILYNMYIW
jgi:hypothetical protein